MRAVNLVPADSRVGRVNGGKSGGAVYGVIGVMVLLLLGLSTLALSKKHEAEAIQELAVVEQSTQAYTTVATQFSSFEQAAGQAEQRISTVRGLAEARFDWAGTLRDLSRLIPANTQIFTLSASVSADSGAAAGATSQFRSAIQSPAVSLTGCSKSQSSVANLVNQLQAMRRVTNVTLDKSERTAAVASAGTAGCSLKGTAYEFSLVVFFAAGKAKASGEVVAATTPATSTIATESASPTTPAATTPATNGAAQ